MSKLDDIAFHLLGIAFALCVPGFTTVLTALSFLTWYERPYLIVYVILSCLAAYGELSRRNNPSIPPWETLVIAWVMGPLLWPFAMYEWIQHPIGNGEVSRAGADDGQ